jgi:hypothetical protein
LTRIYVLFFVSLEGRRVEFVASTTNPDGRWVAQQARNLMMQLDDAAQASLPPDRGNDAGGGNAKAHQRMLLPPSNARQVSDFHHVPGPDWEPSPLGFRSILQRR